MKENQLELESCFGGEILPSVPDPLLIDRPSSRKLFDEISKLSLLLEKAAKDLIQNRSLETELGFSKTHASWIYKSFHKDDPLMPIARIDGMWTGKDQFKIVEINTDGSTGVHDAYALGQSALKTALGKN